ncbi:Thiamin ABC transporter, ATPase component / Thiamine transport ATP-binding protein thiQ [Salipiger mucosus DSM 16094]|uniref:Thiamin ABC transporter, ATPase component / Thiamine transport ATP-binding protein thiQ n=1 Tax=Salipiger mucosus DSM 16094 TaxID=1123237 RepID=S9S9D7_9RHOB|nr:Thiamin ABC transporter, ATPase component / Thiamine transport ATP-binding protein thiQ [Salipiger mucosus DSM 16094]
MGAGDFALDADLALAPGRRVAVIGPSGAGKSTLLDAIAGFRRPARGRILWGGQDVTEAPPDRRPVASLFQENNLFPHLDLVRNLGLALRPDGARPRREAVAQVEAALARVGLAGLGGRRPGALSGGQQGRAALARVLLQRRPIMALDEPFSALGPALKAEMLEIVRDVAQELGALTLLVTHDPEDARRFAEEVVFVADGLAHPPVMTEALFADPPEALRAYLGR